MSYQIEHLVGCPQLGNPHATCSCPRGGVGGGVVGANILINANGYGPVENVCMKHGRFGSSDAGTSCPRCDMEAQPPGSVTILAAVPGGGVGGGPESRELQIMPNPSKHDTLRGFAGQPQHLWKGINPHDYDAEQEFSPSGRKSTGRFYDPPRDIGPQHAEALRAMLMQAGVQFQEHPVGEILFGKVKTERKPAVSQILILAGDIDVHCYFDADGRLVEVEAAVGVTDMDRMEATLTNAGVEFEIQRGEGRIVMTDWSPTSRRRSSLAESSWHFDVAGKLERVEHRALPE